MRTSCLEESLMLAQKDMPAPVVAIAICFDHSYATDPTAVLSDATGIHTQNANNSFVHARMAPDMDNVSLKLKEFADTTNQTLSVSTHSRVIEASVRGFFFVFPSKDLRDQAFAAYQAL
jgi:hypothetical protein